MAITVYLKQLNIKLKTTTNTEYIHEKSISKLNKYVPNSFCV